MASDGLDGKKIDRTFVEELHEVPCGDFDIFHVIQISRFTANLQFIRENFTARKNFSDFFIIFVHL